MTEIHRNLSAVDVLELRAIAHRLAYKLHDVESKSPTVKKCQEVLEWSDLQPLRRHEPDFDTIRFSLLKPDNNSWTTVKRIRIARTRETVTLNDRGVLLILVERVKESKSGPDEWFPEAEFILEAEETEDTLLEHLASALLQTEDNARYYTDRVQNGLTNALVSQEIVPWILNALELKGGEDVKIHTSTILSNYWAWITIPRFARDNVKPVNIFVTLQKTASIQQLAKSEYFETSQLVVAADDTNLYAYMPFAFQSRFAGPADTRTWLRDTLTRTCTLTKTNRSTFGNLTPLYLLWQDLAAQTFDNEREDRKLEWIPSMPLLTDVHANQRRTPYADVPGFRVDEKRTFNVKITLDSRQSSLWIGARLPDPQGVEAGPVLLQVTVSSVQGGAEVDNFLWPMTRPYTNSEGNYNNYDSWKYLPLWQMLNKDKPTEEERQRADSILALVRAKNNWPETVQTYKLSHPRTYSSITYFKTPSVYTDSWLLLPFNPTSTYTPIIFWINDRQRYWRVLEEKDATDAEKVANSIVIQLTSVAVEKDREEARQAVAESDRRRAAAELAIAQSVGQPPVQQPAVQQPPVQQPPVQQPPVQQPPVQQPPVQQPAVTPSREIKRTVPRVLKSKLDPPFPLGLRSVELSTYKDTDDYIVYDTMLANALAFSAFNAVMKYGLLLQRVEEKLVGVDPDATFCAKLARVTGARTSTLPRPDARETKERERFSIEWTQARIPVHVDTGYPEDHKTIVSLPDGLPGTYTYTAEQSIPWHEDEFTRIVLFVDEVTSWIATLTVKAQWQIGANVAVLNTNLNQWDVGVIRAIQETPVAASPALKAVKRTGRHVVYQVFLPAGKITRIVPSFMLAPYTRFRFPTTTLSVGDRVFEGMDSWPIGSYVLIPSFTTAAADKKEDPIIHDAIVLQDNPNAVEPIRQASHLVSVAECTKHWLLVAQQRRELVNPFFVRDSAFRQRLCSQLKRLLPEAKVVLVEHVYTDARIEDDVATAVNHGAKVRTNEHTRAALILAFTDVSLNEPNLQVVIVWTSPADRAGYVTYRTSVVIASSGSVTSVPFDLQPAIMHVDAERSEGMQVYARSIVGVLRTPRSARPPQQLDVETTPGSGRSSPTDIEL